METSPIPLPSEPTLPVAAGTGTEVPRIPLCSSKPPPKPRYQPSPAKAGVLSAAAATVAMASKRSFIFLPSLKMPMAGSPANLLKNQCSAYNGDPPKCLHRHAALREISALLPRFYPCPVTPRQQHKKRSGPELPCAFVGFLDSFALILSQMAGVSPRISQIR